MNLEAKYVARDTADECESQALALRRAAAKEKSVAKATRMRAAASKLDAAARRFYEAGYEYGRDIDYGDKAGKHLIQARRHRDDARAILK